MVPYLILIEGRAVGYSCERNHPSPLLSKIDKNKSSSFRGDVNSTFFLLLVKVAIFEGRQQLNQQSFGQGWSIGFKFMNCMDGLLTTHWGCQMMAISHMILLLKGAKTPLGKPVQS